MLPPSAFALYSNIAKQEGGLNGFLSSLKDKDLQGVIDEVKKAGGDDVKRVVDKVEKKLKEAKGKASDVDWRGLAQELKSELPEGSQKAVDVSGLGSRGGEPEPLSQQRVFCRTGCCTMPVVLCFADPL
jgi:hypothetical protein